MMIPKEEDFDDYQEVAKGEIFMMTVHANDHIIKCYDSMQDGGKMWMILEEMDGDIEAIIKHFNAKYPSEEFIKYLIYKIVTGLNYLHE